jgi:hypothetical protein
LIIRVEEHCRLFRPSMKLCFCDTEVDVAAIAATKVLNAFINVLGE